VADQAINDYFFHLGNIKKSEKVIPKSKPASIIARKNFRVSEVVI
jgi:hypothetical protein